MMTNNMRIRPALASDKSAIWVILEPIVRSGIYYHGFPSNMPEQEMLAFWFSPGHEIFVAESDGVVVGTYVLRADPSGEDRVANCAYGTINNFEGRGVGHAMCGHSLAIARERGYEAMQFNQVISTNTRAVKLWERNGFEITGLAPNPFVHPSLGLTDMYVMYRKL
jgi:ribosomal protein S18 acetylase RimI-like enzyme